MDLVIAGAFVLIPLMAVALVLVIVLRRRAATADRDDTKRVGQDSPATGDAATRRATGEAAWMRPDGGGL